MTKPRTLNVDRMRRYLARTSPNVLRITLPVGEESHREAQARLDHWQQHMRVKHGPDVKVEVHSWLDTDRQRGTVEARVVK